MGVREPPPHLTVPAVPRPEARWCPSRPLRYGTQLHPNTSGVRALGGQGLAGESSHLARSPPGTGVALAEAEDEDEDAGETEARPRGPSGTSPRQHLQCLEGPQGGRGQPPVWDRHTRMAPPWPLGL